MYGLFNGSPAAQTVFLELLEPYVLTQRLPALPPPLLLALGRRTTAHPAWRQSLGRCTIATLPCVRACELVHAQK